MRTKIVYVLVSQETDYYYEMFRLSLYSLRIYHPKDNTEVVLVMDNNTSQRLQKEKRPFLNDVTKIIVDISEDYTVMQRSRYLKTKLREIVEGDFLYIDLDTIICECLDDIDKIDDYIAMAVNDEHGSLKLTKQSTIDICKRAGFANLANKPFYNGGVAFVKDCPVSYRLYSEWHKLWKLSVCNGIGQDQPALCQANVNTGYPIQPLSSIWNCPIYQSQAATKVNEAIILHYYSSLDRGKIGEMIFSHLKEINEADEIVNYIAHYPRTIGYLFFSFNDIRIQQLMSLNLLSLYENNPPFFRLIATLSRLLGIPVRIASNIKENAKSIFK